MAPSFQEDLKAYKSLKLGPFRPTAHDTLEIAREFLNYIERVDSVFTELEVSDPDRKVTNRRNKSLCVEIRRYYFPNVFELS